MDKERLTLSTLPRNSEWIKVRRIFLKTHRQCEFCGSRKRDAHHILPAWKYPEVELEPDNLMALCKQCHFVFGHLFNWKKYNIFLKQDLEIWRKKVKEAPKWR